MSQLDSISLLYEYVLKVLTIRLIPPKLFSVIYNMYHPILNCFDKGSTLGPKPSKENFHFLID